MPLPRLRSHKGARPRDPSAKVVPTGGHLLTPSLDSHPLPLSHGHAGGRKGTTETADDQRLASRHSRGTWGSDVVPHPATLQLGQGAMVSYPPPPCANTGQVLVPGPKVRKHGVPVFGQARVSARHVLRNTSCRHSPTNRS